MTQTEEPKIKVEKRGHLLLIGLNRPLKRNAFDQQMLDELALAVTRLEDEADVRCGVIYAEGEMFTAGLDLAQIAPAIAAGGKLAYPENSLSNLVINRAIKVHTALGAGLLESAYKECLFF